MKRYVFYNNEKLILGISEVMYKGKWYLVLYKTATTDYLIIKSNGIYIKVDKYDVEDCRYNNIVESEDSVVRLMTQSELIEQISLGANIIRENYDIKVIYAIVNDMEVNYFDNIILFLKDDVIEAINPISDEPSDIDYCDNFRNIIKKFSKLSSSNDRKGINKIMVRNFPSRMFHALNDLLDDYGIVVDSDAHSKVSDKDFIIDLLNLMDEYCIEE